jgi:ATP-binding cassette subfamily D (ALD) long-chain fatty acid import protein
MAHSRIITNSEEIAFYNGEDREKSILNKTYSNLIKHINQTYRTKISFNMLEDFVIKYCWSAVGLMIASIPVFMPEYAGGRTKRYELELSRLEEQGDAVGVSKMDRKTGSRTQGFITNKR